MYVRDRICGETGTEKEKTNAKSLRTASTRVKRPLFEEPLCSCDSGASLVARVGGQLQVPQPTQLHTTPPAGHKVDSGSCTICAYIYMENFNADRFMLNF